MSDGGRERLGISAHLPGIFQSLMANAIVGALLPPVVREYERVFHHDAPKWVEGVGPSVVGALVLPLIYLSVKGGRWISRRRANRTPRAEGNRIAILVAKLGEHAESERDAVMNSIRKELGGVVEVIPSGVQLERVSGVNDEKSLLKPTEQAHKLLRSKRADRPDDMGPDPPDRRKDADRTSLCYGGAA